MPLSTPVAARAGALLLAFSVFGPAHAFTFHRHAPALRLRRAGGVVVRASMLPREREQPPQKLAVLAPSASSAVTTVRWINRAPPAAEAKKKNAQPDSWGVAECVQSRALRYLPWAVLAAWIARPAAFDAGIAAVWVRLYQWDFAHHCMFEACTASFGFFIAIIGWSSAHVLLWPSWGRRRGGGGDSSSSDVDRGDDDSVAAASGEGARRRGDRAAAMRRFRLDGAAPVAAFEWAGELGPRRMLGAWLPLFAYLGSIAAFHCFVAKPPLPAAPPTFARFAGELAAGIVAYDALFALVHRSLHAPRSPGWWKALHRTHHTARRGSGRTGALAPLETVQHSFMDGFLQVAANVAVQRLALWGIWAGLGAGLPKHPLSKVVHNLLVTYLLVEAHSGFDLPWMTHRVWPRVFGGARAHDAHHTHGTRNYHQFFHPN